MAQYIDKDALVAEIKRRKGMCDNHYGDYWNGCYNTFTDILSFINALVVKEVDIKDSIKETLAQKYVDYTSKRHNIDANSKEGQLIYYAYMHGMNQCLNQLKAQKGEELC